MACEDFPVEDVKLKRIPWIASVLTAGENAVNALSEMQRLSELKANGPLEWLLSDLPEDVLELAGSFERIRAAQCRRTMPSVMLRRRPARTRTICSKSARSSTSGERSWWRR